MSLADLSSALQAQVDQRKELERPVLAQSAADQFQDPDHVLLSNKGAVTTQDPVKATKGLLSGEFQADEQADYRVLDPVDNTVKTVRGREVLKALQSGWSLDGLENRAQRYDQARIDQLRQEAEASPLTTFGRETLNELAAGIPERFDTPAEAERRAVEREVNPVAAGLGQAAGVVGTAATIAATGGMAGAGRLGASVGTRLAVRTGARGLAQRALATGARWGAESALLEVPRVATEAAFGEPKQAAEHLLMAVGLGSVLGGALSVGKSSARGISAALKRGAGVVPQASLDDAAAKVSSARMKSIFKADDDTLKWIERNPELGVKWRESPQDYVGRVKQEANSLAGSARSQAQASIGASTLARDELLGSVKGSQRKKFEGLLEDVVEVESSAVVDAAGRVSPPVKHVDVASLLQARSQLVQARDKAALKALDAALEPRLGKQGMAALRQGEAEALKRSRFAEDWAKKTEESRQAWHSQAWNLLTSAKGLASGAVLNPSMAPMQMVGFAFRQAGGLKAAEAALLSRFGTSPALAQALKQQGKTDVMRAAYGGSPVFVVTDALINSGAKTVDLLARGAQSGLPQLAARPVLSYLSRSNNRRQATVDAVSSLHNMKQVLAQRPLDTSSFLERDAPGLAQVHTQHVSQAVDHLLSVAPGSRRDPIDGDVLPSPAEVDAFERHLEAAFTPGQVVRNANKGILSKEHVETLMQVYPALYARLQAKAQQEKASDQEKHKRVQALIAGVDRQDAARRRQVMSQIWGQEQDQPQQEQRGGAPRQLKNMVGALSSNASDLNAADASAERTSL